MNWKSFFIDYTHTLSGAALAGVIHLTLSPITWQGFWIVLAASFISFVASILIRDPAPTSED